MSIPVELQTLAGIVHDYRSAYLMTNSEKGAPHAVQVAAVLEGGDVVVSTVGRRTRDNALARPAVGLLWPPKAEGDYSLIVDGEARVEGDAIRIKPTRAVLHRPSSAPRAPAEGSCASDCVELSVRAS